MAKVIGGKDITDFDKAGLLAGLHEDIACRNLIAYYYIYLDNHGQTITKLEVAQWMWAFRNQLALTPKEQSRVQAVLNRI